MKAIVQSTILSDIPDESGNFSVQYPSFKGTYGDVSEEIKKAELEKMTSAQTASLVYDAFKNKDDKYCSEITPILKDDLFWEFTGNLYLPKSNEEINNGVILDLNPVIENKRLIMNKNSLIERLKNNDKNVKFVPFGYKIGEQSSLELFKNPYIIARYGEEGADKIAQIADEFEKSPKLWSYDFIDNELVKGSALYSRWAFGAGLGVNGSYSDSNFMGHSFGVCITD